jgi:YfiH family protein
MVKKPSVIAFTTTRRQGNARHPSTLGTLLAARRVPGRIATAKQVHGSRIVVVPRLRKSRHYPGVDGFLTAAPNQPLGIFTADCASIFLSAPSQGLVGLLHAGWRGVRGGILPKALRLMRKRWHCPSRAVHVWLGPTIGPCCFEVRWDTARHFPATRRKQGDRWRVDLAEEIRRQARRLGARVVPAPASCTRHTVQYHSFRRDQTDERQISVIMRRDHGIA